MADISVTYRACFPEVVALPVVLEVVRNLRSALSGLLRFRGTGMMAGVSLSRPGVIRLDERQRLLSTWMMQSVDSILFGGTDAGSPIARRAVARSRFEARPRPG